jgi:hypothetical protein
LHPLKEKIRHKERVAGPVEGQAVERLAGAKNSAAHSPHDHLRVLIPIIYYEQRLL